MGVYLGAGVVTGVGVATWSAAIRYCIPGLAIATILAMMTAALACAALGVGALATVLRALFVSAGVTVPLRTMRG